MNTDVMTGPVNDPDLLRRLAGRIGAGHRVANPVFLAYRYEGDDRERVVAEFRRTIEEIGAFRCTFVISPSGGIHYGSPCEASLTIELDCTGAPPWLVEDIVWSMLRTNFRLDAGPAGLGFVVHTRDATYFGVSGDHAVADGVLIDEIFRRFFDRLEGSPTPPSRAARNSSPRPSSAARARYRESSDLPAWQPEELARRLTESVQIFQEGEHRSSLSESIYVDNPGLNNGRARYGVSDVCLLASAYALAMMEVNGRERATFVMPFTGRLADAAEIRAETSRLMPISVVTAGPPTVSAVVKQVQAAISRLLRDGRSVTEVWQNTDINRTHRVPWAFFVWRRALKSPSEMTLIDVPVGQLVSVRPGVSLAATAEPLGTRLTLRAQYT
ncbi:MAG: hypothetical protein HOV77_34030, partial [Hamadaea sp.]|uniref:hypothetical protein n=1 Tax=Hamadaea sp. TaxID=2024425 RepID=UPI0017A76FB3